ncbi:MAG: transketolase [Halobacteriovoraceae bacterium]|nr:transketolase [Halobacteriovoraceae bacterium]
MRDHFIKKLSELVETDDKVLLITGDLGFGVFDKYREKFPEKFINAGIAEQNMAGLATGMALEGFKVFIYSIGNFSTLRCLEQIRNDACYHNACVNVVSIGGGFSYGQLGMSHHATEDLSILRSFPMDVFVPSNFNEVEQITEYMANNPGTKYLRLDKDTGPQDQAKIEIGKPRQVSEGDDLTFVVSGGIYKECVAASEKLKEKGLNARIILVHSLNSPDTGLIERAARETKGVITVEENTVRGGLGGYIAENLLENGIVPGFFKRIGLREGFSSVVGSQTYLRKHYKMDADYITKCSLELLGKVL